jgi:hypothetical protein
VHFVVIAAASIVHGVEWEDPLVAWRAGRLIGWIDLPIDALAARLMQTEMLPEAWYRAAPAAYVVVQEILSYGILGGVVWSALSVAMWRAWRAMSRG